MDVETLESDFLSVENGSEDNNTRNGAVNGHTEPITFGSHGTKTVNGEGKNGPVMKDVVDEWPAAEKIYSFYFVKYRKYEDPKLRSKKDSAEKELEKKKSARFQILDKIRAKKSERAELIAQMKPLSAENRQFWSVMDEKRKEMEPLQQALGKLRSNNARGDKGVPICSSEEELNSLIKSLHYRIAHESIPLTEEKLIIREIKQLEGTREKVIANAAARTKIQESLGGKDDLQDQVKLIGVGLDEVRKEQQAIKAKLNQLSAEKLAIDKDIEALEAEFATATEIKDKAKQAVDELWAQQGEGNASFHQNNALLNEARRLAATKDVEGLRELSNLEIEKFMAMWNKSKPFRDDYEMRILPSLDIRQLSRDGRMRNPDEKPLVPQQPSTSFQPESIAKPKPKQTKEEPVISSSKIDVVPVDNSQKETKSKPNKEVKNSKSLKAKDLDEEDEVIIFEKPKKVEPKVDEAKLKEIRREEEIAKAKLALERKKKLAEKAAAKAAAKAQKEAEKKLKDQEKKLKKKAAASGTLPEPEEQPTEAGSDVAELEKTKENTEEPVVSKTKGRKENAVRSRTRSKGPESISKVILKRKKSTNYWVWAAPAALAVMLVFVIGYKYLV